MQRSAHVEAISHLNKGLGLLKTLPDTLQRSQHELVLQTTLGLAVTANKGFAASEVEQVYARALELCQHVGESSQTFPVLCGLWGFYLVRAEYTTAHELAKQCLTLAQRQHDPAFLLPAHWILGGALFWLGEVAPAQVHLEQGMALYDFQQHRSLAFRYGQDFGVGFRAFTTHTLWLLGYPDQALERGHEALTLAQELSHPSSLAWALFFAARLHQFRREEQAVRERAEAVIALSAEQGFPNWMVPATTLRDWMLAEQGQGEGVMLQIRHSLASRSATGAKLGQSYFLAILAEMYGNGGQAEEGLSVLTEALEFVDKTGERFYEAELHRLKGELLLLQSSDNHAEAEICFQKALNVARQQQAKSLELRSSTSLSKLWQQQGKREEARQLLSEIYGWFTEGFDTLDLKDAKALLDELAESR